LIVGEGDDRVVREVTWRYLDKPGLERCALSTADGWWRWDGTAVAVFDGRPTGVAYRIVCSPDWATREAEVTVRIAGQTRSLRLWTDGNGRWFGPLGEVTDLRGAMDVDIELGASTNTLPIRRIPLEVGGSVELVAAWVRFPGLTVEPLAQRYTRLGPGRYRYESVDSGFTRDLEVDDLAIVVTYPDWCERIAAWEPPAQAP
jgi:hypothetical protein